MYRQRFGLSGHPLPKDAQGKTFFDKTPGYKKLERAFGQLVEDPGLGVLTADAGVGKTAAIRNLCASLPRPDHFVLGIGRISGGSHRTGRHRRSGNGCYVN